MVFVSGTKSLKKWPLLSCIRYREVLLLQGSPWMGSLFTIQHLRTSMLPAGGLFVMGSFFLVAHMWTLNDWADAPLDIFDSRRTRKIEVSLSALLRFSLVLLLISLCLFALLPSPTLTLAASIAGLGFLYSCLFLKRIAIVSSVLHFVGGVLQFFLGCAVFGTIDRKAVLFAFFFAIIFTTGHAIQEIRDADADKNVGIKTNAVVFGKRRVFFVAVGGFVVAYAYLSFLAAICLVPRPLEALSLVLMVLNVLASVKAFRGGLTYEDVKRFRREYRISFVLIGIYLFCSFVFRAVGGGVR